MITYKSGTSNLRNLVTSENRNGHPENGWKFAIRVTESNYMHFFILPTLTLALKTFLLFKPSVTTIHDRIAENQNKLEYMLDSTALQL